MREISGWIAAWALGTVTLSVWPSSAIAALSICNDRKVTVELAVMRTANAGPGLVTEGWWSVEPGQCATPVKRPLKRGEPLYLSVRESGRSLVPADKGKFACIGVSKFAVDAQRCPTKQKAAFVELTGDAEVLMYGLSAALASIQSNTATFAMAQATYSKQPKTIVTGGRMGSASAQGSSDQDRAVAVPDLFRGAGGVVGRGEFEGPRLTRPTRPVPGASEGTASNSPPRPTVDGLATQPLSTVSPLSAEKRKLCAALGKSIPKPRLRSEAITLATYTDIGTPQQSKMNCVPFDTGVPDVKTCKTSTDSCGYRDDLLKTCWPTTHTSCSNMVGCRPHSIQWRAMRCDLQVQLKLPNFVEKPILEFFDKANALRNQLNDSLPLECAPPEVQRSAPGQVGEALARAVTSEIQRRVETALRREAQAWLNEQLVKAIVVSVPTGGVGGAAVMSTSLAEVVYRVHRAVSTTLNHLNDAKALAEDLGFSTSCGWTDWQ